MFDFGAYNANPTAVNAGLRWNKIDPSVLAIRRSLAYEVLPALRSRIRCIGNCKAFCAAGSANLPYQIALRTTQRRVPEERTLRSSPNFTTPTSSDIDEQYSVVQRTDGHSQFCLRDRLQYQRVRQRRRLPPLHQNVQLL